MTRRRRIGWMAAILVVAALLVPAVAVAAPDSMTSVQAPNSALSWTNVRDSDGVPLSSYMFVSSDPNILDPLGTMLALMLQLLFVVWLVFVTLAIWVIGYALSFGFLNLFAEVLLGTASLFAGQIGTTIVLITAATVGAFFVSYFVMRGLYAKATTQVVTMIAVAVFGVVFLTRPLADVLGPDGLLAKGRDLGISVAAGLHGDSNPDPDNLVATMQASLADNFARKPLQAWNFGHVIDDQCGSAWSSGMMSGDSDHVKSALRACDSAAYATVDQPTFGQVGAGLVLFLCGVVLVWFAIKLGLRVIRTAWNAVFHGFLSIFGFAAGGYIYGPTQTFLVRNLVDTVFSCFAMAAYTIFLAIYVLILGDVFRQATGHVMQVFFIGALLMLIAARQVDSLRAGLQSGGQWVASRFAMATQGGGGGGGGGGGVPGIGAGSSSVPASTWLQWMTFTNTVNANPWVARLFGNVNSPFSPYARRRQRKELQDYRMADKGWPEEWQRYHAGSREAALDAGRRAMKRNEHRPAAIQYAWALDNMLDRNILAQHIDPALLDLEIEKADKELLHGLRTAQAAVNATVSQIGPQFPSVWKALAAWRATRNYPGAETVINVGDDRVLRVPPISPGQHKAFAAWSEVTAANFKRHAPKVWDPAKADIDWGFVDRVRDNWEKPKEKREPVTDDEWNSVSRETRWVIGSDLADAFNTAIREYNQNPTEENANKADKIAAQIMDVLSGDPDRVADPWSTK